jgi:formyltetrahydrofolate deformylase
MSARGFILRASGAPKKGVMAALSALVAESDGLILECQVHREAAQFFLRNVIEASGSAAAEARLRAGLDSAARELGLSIELTPTDHRPRVLIAVSKLGHCLYDLLHRWRAGKLPVDVVGVVSNHEDMRSFVEWNGLAYHHLPIAPDRKAEQEARFEAIMAAEGVDLLVLARYMQVLSPGLCERLAGRCINIHHSFLPSFRGAKPYHQAHSRGVKIIGATAHFVTADLDEGPIIEQDVQRVHHGLDPEALVNIGRDIECRVLARAVAWQVEQRVFINGARTVVFS